MADVDGRRERAPEQRSDDRSGAVREQDLAQVVLVAGGGRALDVVHPFGEIVDPERDRRYQQRPDVGEAGEHVERRDRQVQPERSEGGGDVGRVHQVAPSEERRAPAGDRPDHDRGETARDPERQPHVRRPRYQHDREREQAQPADFPHLERRAQRNEGDRDPGQRSEHRGARRIFADRRADERAEQNDAADDEAPR